MPNKKDAHEEFEQALAHAVRATAAAFEASATRLTRADYFASSKGAHVDGGGIYAFFGKGGACLYVGESGMALRKREAKHPSPLTAETWWSEWQSVLVLVEESRPRRELFERLLLLALSPRNLRHKQIVRK